MSKPIDDLRQQLQALLDSTDNKEMIGKIGSMNSLIDNIESEHNQIHEEQKELLKDYKELVKHQSFKSNGTEDTQVTETKEVSFDDFLKVRPNQNNN